MSTWEEQHPEHFTFSSKLNAIEVERKTSRKYATATATTGVAGTRILSSFALSMCTDYGHWSQATINDFRCVWNYSIYLFFLLWLFRFRIDWTVRWFHVVSVCLLCVSWFLCSFTTGSYPSSYVCMHERFFSDNNRMLNTFAFDFR